MIARALAQSGPEVGNAVAATCQFSMRTPDAIPKSAGVSVFMRLTDGETASEWLPAGTFYISRRSRDPGTGVLTLECYDALLKANALWQPGRENWPRPMADVAGDIAALLGLELDERTQLATGANYVIDAPESDVTLRQVLGRIAACNGGNWVVTPENRLRLVPLVPDGPETVDTVAVLGAAEVGEPCAITGIRCGDDGEGSTLVGDASGAVVDADIPPVVAADLAETLIGAAYRPYALQAAIYDPAAELGDAVTYGAGIAGVLYSEKATLAAAFRGDISAPAGAELADEYPYIGGAARTLSVAKAYVRQAVDALDAGLTQRELFNRLTDDGAAQGIVLADGQLYMNASYINTGTLAAERVNLQGYASPLRVPDEWDARTLLPGQAVSDGWITEGGGDVTVLRIDDTSLCRGMSLSVSAQIDRQPSSGMFIWTEIVEEEDGSETYMEHEEPWVTPTFGAEDADGTLVGATTDADHYRYTRTLQVPETARTCRLKFGCGKARRISAAFDLSDELTLRYDTNIGLSNQGLQVGRFVVDRPGNVTADGSVRLNGPVQAAGKVTLDSPLPVASGGTGAATAADARANLEVPSRTGSGASGSWGISVTGSSGSCTGNAATATKATSADYLETYNADGGGGTSNIDCLKKVFDTVPKSRGTAVKLMHGSHSMAFGWFLAGYAMDKGYGGWFVSDYGTPTWVGLTAGTWSSAAFLTSANYTSYAPTRTGSGASGTWGINVTGSSGSCTGNAANVTGTVAVGHGGTGATTAANARANLGLNDIGGIAQQSQLTNLRHDGVDTTITISKDCWLCASFHVTANVSGKCLLYHNGNLVIANVATDGACNYWANAQIPVKAGAVVKYNLNSNATDSVIKFLGPS